MPKGKKGKKGRRRGDSDDDDFVDPVAAATADDAGGDGGDADADVSQSKPLTKAQRKKLEKQKKKQAQAQRAADDDDDDDEDPIAAALKKGGDPDDDEDEDDSEEEQTKPLTKAQRKKLEKQKKKQAQAQRAADDDDDDDEDPIAAALKKGGDPDDDEDEDDSEEEQTKPLTKAQRKKLEKQKKKQAQAQRAADDDDDDDEDPIAAALKKGGDPDDDEDEDDEDDEPETKQATTSMFGFGDDDDDDDDDDDEEEARKTEKKKKEKKEKKSKKSKKSKKDKKSKEKEVASDDSDGAEESKGGGESGDDESTAKKSKKGKKEKLSRKERKAKEKLERLQAEEAEMWRMTHKDEGEQFAVSQPPVDETDQLWLNATDIHLEKFTISTDKKTLFEDAELKIVDGGHYGLVGPNGMGKSTILKMIASGRLIIPPRIDVLYVEQEVVPDETPACEAVLRADKERTALMEQQKDLEARAEKDEDVSAELAEVYDNLNAIGADAAEAKARKILFGLGFTEEMQDRPTKKFSGGWRMRISLARALFIEPTLLFLDEPTNHLDLNAVIWLDDYLQSYKKSLLVVSHDADFLNSVCGEIMHLHQRKITQYKGNYDDFVNMFEQKQKVAVKAYEKQEKRLRALKASGSSKKGAEEKFKKKVREPGARSAKAKAAQVLGSEEVKTTELLERPKDYTVTLSFAEVPQLSPPIIQINDVDFKYETMDEPLFKGLSFGLDLTSRVCVVGPNGVGKTTLLNIITGEVEPEEGDVRRNNKLRVGKYNQHFMDVLPMGVTPTDYLKDKYSVPYQDVRNLLGKFGLEGHAHEVNMRDCSGGQKARVVFCELSLMNPHIMFLDEPTNNLDLETIDALCDAIRRFNGGIVIVSHDARLIEACNCQLWVVGNKNVKPFPGGFPAYRQHLIDEVDAYAASLEQKLGLEGGDGAGRKAARSMRHTAGMGDGAAAGMTDKKEAAPKKTGKWGSVGDLKKGVTGVGAAKKGKWGSVKDLKASVSSKRS